MLNEVEQFFNVDNLNPKATNGKLYWNPRSCSLEVLSQKIHDVLKCPTKLMKNRRKMRRRTGNRASQRIGMGGMHGHARLCAPFVFSAWSCRTVQRSCIYCSLSLCFPWSSGLHRVIILIEIPLHKLSFLAIPAQIFEKQGISPISEIWTKLTS